MMKLYLRGLTMTAALLSTSVAFSADQIASSYVGDSEADYYGEEAAPSEYPITEQSDNEDASIVQASASLHAGDEAMAPRSSVQAASSYNGSPAPYAPQAAYVPANPYQAVGFRQNRASHSMSSDCDGSCNGSCNGGCAARGRFSRLMSNRCPDVWLQAETLLWFSQTRTTPPLVALAPAGELPFLGNPNATVVGDQYGNNLAPGLRLDFGKYFGNGNFGIGGRLWGLTDDDESLSLSGDGTGQSIGRPFFNSGIGIEDAVFVAFEAGGVDDFQGSVSGQTSLSLVAAEAYGRMNLGSGNEYHTDLIGGYSYFGIDDDLAIRSTSIDKEDGGVTTFSDSFRAKNRFHGGQLGAETILRRGRWVARSLTKVHLGNMNQTMAMEGRATVTDNNLAPLQTFNRGLLVADGNRGVFQRDQFAFAPELNLKLGYRFRDHVTFTVGYSFIYWNNVALAGQHIDRNIDLDTTNLAAVTQSPAFRFRNSGFWAQGVDLGTTIEF